MSKGAALFLVASMILSIFLIDSRNTINKQNDYIANMESYNLELEEKILELDVKNADLRKEVSQLYDKIQTLNNKITSLESKVKSSSSSSSSSPSSSNPYLDNAKKYASESYCWIPNSGTKYHSSSSCSNMKNPTYVTIQYAIYAGYDQCSKCW